MSAKRFNYSASATPPPNIKQLTDQDIQQRCLLISQIAAFTNYKCMNAMHQNACIQLALEAMQTGLSMQEAYNKAIAAAEKAHERLLKHNQETGHAR